MKRSGCLILNADRVGMYGCKWSMGHSQSEKHHRHELFYCSEVAKKVALKCVQILGGYGYTMEYDAQRYLRDVLILSIGGGTIQIQKNIVGRTIGLKKIIIEGGHHESKR